MDEQEKFVFKKYWLSQVKLGTYTGDCLTVEADRVYRVNTIATVVSKFVSDDNNYAAIILDDGSATIRAKAWKEDVNRFSRLDVGDLVNFFGNVREYEGEVYLAPAIITNIRNPNWEVARRLELVKLRGKPKDVLARANVVESDLPQTKADAIATKPAVPQQIQEQKQVPGEQTPVSAKEASSAKPVEQKTPASAQKSLEEPKAEQKTPAPVPKAEELVSARQLVSVIRSLDAGHGADINLIIEKSGKTRDQVIAIVRNLMDKGDVYEPEPNKLKVLE
ncbi:hypothetical protein COT72_02670 [archaeon CG10_big_fil_rev_8_21_14_0_10_43_11]|nr:MAG: hypothetical protein COT72_02670 [archaeon CG10_big_fil_rev_8_21_14_0_10_43_11]